MSRKNVLDLPDEFYQRRGWLSDALGACVLWEPSRKPSRAALPRDMLSDSNLRTLLAYAVTVRKPERLAYVVGSDLGSAYIERLLRLLGVFPVCRPEVFIWNVDWYAKQLRDAEAIYKRHLDMLANLDSLQKLAAQEFWTETQPDRA